MRSKGYAIFLLLLFSSTVESRVDSNPWQGLETVGKSTLRFALWQIYDAELLSPNGQYQPKPPLALRITYRMPIKSDALVDETGKQWRKLYPLLGEKKDNWLNQLSRIFPSVKKGDEITFFVDNDYQSNFYLNGTLLGFIEDPEFYQHFSGIWLSEETSRPRLRKKLLGE